MDFWSYYWQICLKLDLTKLDIVVTVIAESGEEKDDFIFFFDKSC